MNLSRLEHVVEMQELYLCKRKMRGQCAPGALLGGVLGQVIYGSPVYQHMQWPWGLIMLYLGKRQGFGQTLSRAIVRGLGCAAGVNPLLLSSTWKWAACRCRGNNS